MKKRLYFVLLLSVCLLPIGQKQLFANPPTLTISHPIVITQIEKTLNFKGEPTTTPIYFNNMFSFKESALWDFLTASSTYWLLGSLVVASAVLWTVFLYCNLKMVQELPMELLNIEEMEEALTSTYSAMETSKPIDNQSFGQFEVVPN